MTPTPPDPGWMPWLDKIGWPLAIMLGGAVVVFWIVRALWAWGRPWLDRWIDAKVKAMEAEAARHAAIAEAMKKLVDKTIEMQEATAASVSDVPKHFPNICRWKQPPP